MLLGRSSSTEVLSPGQSPITSTFSLIGSSSTDNDVHICLINHLRIRGWIAIFQGIPWQWLGFPHPPRPHRPAPLLPRLSPPHPLPLGQAQGHHGRIVIMLLTEHLLFSPPSSSEGSWNEKFANHTRSHYKRQNYPRTKLVQNQHPHFLVLSKKSSLTAKYI